MNTFEAQVVIHMIDKVSGALAHISKGFAQTHTAAQALQNRLNSIHHTFNSGMVMAAGGAALAAPLVACTNEAIKLETALARVKIQTNASDDQMKMLNETFTKTSNLTGIFSKPTLAGFAAEMYSSGIRDINQINQLMPMFAQAADVGVLLSDGKIKPHDTLHGLVAIAHQFGKYDPKSLEPIVQAAMSMSLALPGGIKSLTATGSSVNIPANRFLGIDPIELMAFQAAVAQTSGSLGAGGGGRLSASNQINALMRALPGMFGAGLLSGKSGFSAAVLGLADKYGASNLMEGEKFNFGAFQSQLASTMQLSPLQIAQRMNAHLGMLTKSQQEDVAPIIYKALQTKGAGVSKSQLLSQLFNWQFGSAGTVAMLMGDEKFLSVQEKMRGRAQSDAKSNGIHRMQEEAMKTAHAQQMRIDTNFKTLQSTIGLRILPHLNAILPKIGDLLDMANKFAEKHPRIVDAGLAIIGVASAALILGGAFNIIRSGFMGLQLVFGPVSTAIKAIGPLLSSGGLTGIMTRLGGALRFAGPHGLALSVAIAAVTAVVMNWNNIMKFVHDNHKIFIHIIARVMQITDKATANFKILISAMADLGAAVGNLINTIGGRIAQIPLLAAAGAKIQELGAKITEGVKTATKITDKQAKSDEEYLKSHGMGNIVQGIKGQPIVQNNTYNLQHPDGDGLLKKLNNQKKADARQLKQAAAASSGNSVGRSVFAGGGGRP